MGHHTLITTLVAAIVLAFVFGFIASRMRLSPIVGFLVAGIAVGPYTPGFEADLNLALQLSEIGVILLMFGVGLKISVEDIWSVRWAAAPSSIIQTVLVALLGMGVGLAFSLPLAEALVLGAALSIASTIVLMRTLEERRLMKTEEGRIAVSFVLLEDLMIVIGIVVLPALVTALSGQSTSMLDVLSAIGLTLGKVAIFVALMLIIGARFFPWLIVQIAHTKSRELLSLGTLALALGVAWAAYAFFDASFALGAFLGGGQGLVPALQFVQHPGHIIQTPIGSPKILCLCVTHSRSCSSSRSACCSIQASLCANRLRWRRSWRWRRPVKPCSPTRRCASWDRTNAPARSPR